MNRSNPIWNNIVNILFIDWINQYVPSEYRESVKEFMAGKKIVKGGTLSIKQISAILFNETRSFSGEKVKQARKEIAHAIINADKKWGDKRAKYAKSAPEKANVPDAEINTYKACLEAAIEAIKEDEKGEDPTNNALYFNFRITDSKKDRGGTKVHTSTGPLDNSYSKYKYANTYGE